MNFMKFGNDQLVMQSSLPEDLERPLIKDLLDFESWKYVVPWAMCVDENGLLWINSTYSFENNECGTCHMKIKKRKNYIIVLKSSIRDHKYSKSANFWKNHQGSTADDFIPVILR